MKAVRYAAPRDFAVVEIATPVPEPGQVLVQVVEAGLCGTDVHVHHGAYPGSFPLTPGHEVVGRVAALGAGVEGFAEGELVSINPNMWCGHCSYCRSGRLGLCENALGIGTTLDGFFAEFACVPASLVFSVEGLSVDTAVFTEPTACAMHGLETIQVRPGSSALVLGAGPTGQLLAQLLATGGAASVTVAGPRRHELETAEALGATQSVAIRRGEPQANLAALRAASDRGAYDVVVEATGATEVGNLCVRLTRNGGTVLLYGVTRPEETIGIEPFDVFRREITIKGSYAEMTSFDAAIAALRAGRVRTDGIITHRFGLDDYGQALEAMTQESAHKVVLMP